MPPAPSPPASAVEAEPRWPALLAVISVGALHWALPAPLRVGPPWLLLAAVGALLVPTVFAARTGRHGLNHVLGNVVAAILTAAMLSALAALVSALPQKTVAPMALLKSAALLWFTNVLVFASWYWRLDAGGPHERWQRAARRGTHERGAFLFPQMVIAQAPSSRRPPDEHAGADADDPEDPGWQPGFVDYLFLAFNTSTAFSPTDTAVLSRWAKLMMMVQASISLLTIAILAARAINIL